MLSLSARCCPGPNVVNLALMFGDRFFGWRGAFAARGGMLVVPLFIVLALTAAVRAVLAPCRGRPARCAAWARWPPG